MSPDGKATTSWFENTKTLTIIKISEFALFTKYGNFKQTVIALFDAEFYTQTLWTESDG